MVTNIQTKQTTIVGRIPTGIICFTNMHIGSEITKTIRQRMMTLIKYFRKESFIMGLITQRRVRNAMTQITRWTIYTDAGEPPNFNTT